MALELLLFELGQEFADFLRVGCGLGLAATPFLGLARDFGRLLRLEALADFVGRQLTQGFFERSFCASRTDPLWRLFIALGSTGDEFLFGDFDIGGRLFVDLLGLLGLLGFLGFLDLGCGRVRRLFVCVRG